MDITQEVGGSTKGHSESLRILALNKRSWHHSKAGGSEINLEESLKRLAERGHDVHLLVGSDEGLPRREHDESVSIRRVGFDDRFPAPWDIVVSYLIVTVYFHWYQYRLSADIVYTVNTPLPWPVVTRVPRISIFHHIAIDTFFETHPFPQNLLGFVSQWFGVLRERGNLTVSVSPSTTSGLLSRGHDPDTVHEIKNGLDLERYRPGKEHETPHILYLGGLDRYKGADRLPQIHEALLDDVEFPVHFDVAGRDGPVSDTVEAYCAQSDHAHFHGFISERKKIELLQSTWVLVAPSRVEGWGITVLEANACGTPAVGSNVAGLRDSIRHQETGLLSDGADPESFAESVGELLVDDGRRRTLSNQARSWAEQHSWEHTVDDLEALFVSAVSGERSRS